jgi:hypothetical protein
MIKCLINSLPIKHQLKPVVLIFAKNLESEYSFKKWKVAQRVRALRFVSMIPKKIV